MKMTPWELGATPTPEQWVDWFVSLARVDQVVVAELAIRNAGMASRCMERGHLVLEERVELLRMRNQELEDAARVGSPAVELLRDESSGREAP